MLVPSLQPSGPKIRFPALAWNAKKKENSEEDDYFYFPPIAGFSRTKVMSSELHAASGFLKKYSKFMILDVF